MCAIPQLVWAPLNPVPIYYKQNILGKATHNVSTVADNAYEQENSPKKTDNNGDDDSVDCDE